MREGLKYAAGSDEHNISQHEVYTSLSIHNYIDVNYLQNS